MVEHGYMKIRVTPEQEDAIKSRAALAKQTVSAYVIAHCLEDRSERPRLSGKKKAPEGAVWASEGVHVGCPRCASWYPEHVATCSKPSDWDGKGRERHPCKECGMPSMAPNSRHARHTEDCSLFDPDVAELEGDVPTPNEVPEETDGEKSETQEPAAPTA